MGDQINLFFGKSDENKVNDVFNAIVMGIKFNSLFKIVPILARFATLTTSE